MLCPACGVGNRPDEKLCSECGTTLPQRASAVFAPPAIGTESFLTVNPPTPAHRPLRAARWRVTALSVIAAVAGVCCIVASALSQLTVRSDAAIGAWLGSYRLNDLAAASVTGGLFSGTNLQVGIILAGLLLIIGAVLSANHRAVGAGLVAGVALALAPVVVVIWGNIVMLSDGATAQAETVKRATRLGTFIETQPAIGFYVLLGATVLALIALVMSLTQAIIDNRVPLNRALCAAGAVAAVVAAVGQFIPQHGAGFRDNFSSDTVDVVLISARLGIVGLLAMCGVLGFMRADRWGIGLVLGTSSLYAWQWLSSIAPIGQLPAPPAFFSPGQPTGTPTIVTTIGVVALLGIATATIVVGRTKEPASP